MSDPFGDLKDMLARHFHGARSGGDPQSVVDQEGLAFLKELRLAAEEVTNLTGLPPREVLRKAVGAYVNAVRLSCIRGGHVLYVEPDGAQKKLKLPVRAA